MLVKVSMHAAAEHQLFALEQRVEVKVTPPAGREAFSKGVAEKMGRKRVCAARVARLLMCLWFCTGSAQSRCFRSCVTWHSADWKKKDAWRPTNARDTHDVTEMQGRLYDFAWNGTRQHISPKAACLFQDSISLPRQRIRIALALQRSAQPCRAL